MDTSSSLKASAIRFLQLAVAGKVDEAFGLIAPDFRHHNPYFASDAASLKAGMLDSFDKNPDKRFEVQRAIAEAPLVVVHSRIQMQPGAPIIAVAHILRFEHGKIAELWDVGQAQPEHMANALGMF